jgi:hypothetical protein
VVPPVPVPVTIPTAFPPAEVPAGTFPGAVPSIVPSPPGVPVPGLPAGYGVEPGAPLPPVIFIIPTVPPGVFTFLGASRRPPG